LYGVIFDNTTLVQGTFVSSSQVYHHIIPYLYMFCVFIYFHTKRFRHPINRHKTTQFLAPTQALLCRYTENDL